MKKCGRCLKIRKDIPALDPLRMERCKAKEQGVPAKENPEKLADLFKIFHFCPLHKVTRKKEKNFKCQKGRNNVFILPRGCDAVQTFMFLTGKKGDAMINNMVLSSEIEWIGYEHNVTCFRWSSLSARFTSMKMSPKLFITNS